MNTIPKEQKISRTTINLVKKKLDRLSIAIRNRVRDKQLWKKSEIRELNKTLNKIVDLEIHLDKIIQFDLNKKKGLRK